MSSDLLRALAEADWETPWVRVADGAGLVAELLRELGPEHPLSGRTLAVVARRDDCDDVLFAVGDPPVSLAVVRTSPGRQSASASRSSPGP